jgi:murein DD-endopeptidase MepM/ murein hydrolase activator NlpD
MPFVVEDFGKTKEVYQDYAKQQAQRIGAPPELFLGLLDHESGWNPFAKNPKSTAEGIGQHLDNSWKMEGGSPEDRNNPWKNIELAANHLQRKYKDVGDWETAVNHYGENNSKYLNTVLQNARNNFGYTGKQASASENKIGMITSTFGDTRDGGERGHKAGDISAPAGTVVRAPVDLEIVATGTGGTNLKDNDSWIWAKDHATGRQYRFAHTGDVSGLKPGDVVSQGQQLTTVGGAIDRPHLHMAVKDEKGQSIDWVKEAGLAKGKNVAGSGGMFSMLANLLGPNSAEAAESGTGYVIESVGQTGTGKSGFVIEDPGQVLTEEDPYELFKRTTKPPEAKKKEASWFARYPGLALAELNEPSTKFLTGITGTIENLINAPSEWLTGQRDPISGNLTAKGEERAKQTYMRPLTTAMQYLMSGPTEYKKSVGDTTIAQDIVTYPFKVAGEIIPYLAPGAIAKTGKVIAGIPGVLTEGQYAQWMTKQATTAMAEKPPLTFAETYLRTLGTFLPVDVARVNADKGKVEPKDLVHTAVNSALFSAASWLPSKTVARMGEHAQNIYGRYVKAVETVGTGSAFLGSSLIAGERDPAALLLNFMTGAGLHIIGSGRSSKVDERAAFKMENFGEYVDKMAKEAKLSLEEQKSVQALLNAPRGTTDVWDYKGEKTVVEGVEVSREQSMPEEQRSFGMNEYDRRVANDKKIDELSNELISITQKYDPAYLSTLSVPVKESVIELAKSIDYRAKQTPGIEVVEGIRPVPKIKSAAESAEVLEKYFNAIDNLDRSPIGRELLADLLGASEKVWPDTEPRRVEPESTKSTKVFEEEINATQSPYRQQFLKELFSAEQRLWPDDVRRDMRSLDGKSVEETAQVFENFYKELEYLTKSMRGREQLRDLLEGEQRIWPEDIASEIESLPSKSAKESTEVLAKALAEEEALCRGMRGKEAHQAQLEKEQAVTESLEGARGRTGDLSDTTSRQAEQSVAMKAGEASTIVDPFVSGQKKDKFSLADRIRNKIFGGSSEEIQKTGYATEKSTEGTAAVDEVRGERRDSDISQNAEAGRQLLEDIKSGLDTERAGQDRWQWWSGIRFSEDVLSNAEFTRAVDIAKKAGIDEVLPVEGAGFLGIIHRTVDGKSVMLLDKDTGVHTFEQVAGHELFHHAVTNKDIAALRLLSEINYKSDIFVEYMKDLNKRRRALGEKDLNTRDAAQELVADYAGGMKAFDYRGRDMNLADVFDSKDVANELLKDYKNGVVGEVDIPIGRKTLSQDQYALKDWVSKVLVNAGTSLKRVGKDLKDVKDSVREEFGVPSDIRAKMIVEDAMARRRSEYQMGEYALSEWKNRLDALPKEDQMKIAAMYQRGEFGQIPKELQGFFDVAKDITNKHIKEINWIAKDNKEKGIGGAKELNYVDNYLRQGMLENYGDENVRRNANNFLSGEPYTDHLDLDAFGQARIKIREVAADGTVTYRDTGQVGPAIESAASGTGPLFRGFAKGKTVTGGKGFFKQKIFADWSEAMRVGYVPKLGLFDLMMADINAKTHYIYGMKAWSVERELGDIKYYRPGKQPDGWEAINDPSGKLNISWVEELRPGQSTAGSLSTASLEGVQFDQGVEPPKLGAKSSMMQAYAPSEVASVWNNFLSQGLTGKVWYDRVRAVLDTTRKLGVSLSPFHAKVIFNNDVATGIGEHGCRALGAMMAGDNARMEMHLKKLGSSVTGHKTVTGIREIRKAVEEFYKPDSNPEMRPLIEDYLSAGGTMPSGASMNLKNSMTDGFREAARELGDGHLLRSVDKFADATSKPIMDYLVPWAKLVAFAEKRKMAVGDSARHWEGREGIAIEWAMDWSVRMRDARSFCDAMYGQLDFDNYHIPRMARDLMFFVIKYPGWNIGSGRWLYNSAKGVYEGTKSLVKGGSVELSDFQRQSMRYTAGLVLKTGLFNGLLYFMLHGSTPDDPTELLTKGVWTGDYNRDGSKQFVRDADYMRDMIGMATDPVHTVLSKMPDIVRMPYDLMKNEDYFGGKIFTPEHPERWPMELGKRVGQSVIPYSVQQISRGSGTLGKFGGMVGLSMTPSKISRTPAENVIADYYGSRAVRGRSPMDREVMERKMDLLDMAKAGNMEGFREGLFDLKREGNITKAGIKRLKEQVKGVKISRYQHLSLEAALEAFTVADDDEKKMFEPILRFKIRRTDVDTRRRLTNEIKGIFSR